MIKLKENQLIAMLEIAKNNQYIDIWDLMTVAGIEKEPEGIAEETHLETHEINIEELLEQDLIINHIFGTLDKLGKL